MVTKALPSTQEDLADVLMDTKRRDALLADPAKFRATFQDYAREFYKRDPEAKAQLKATMTEAMDELLKRNDIQGKRLAMDESAANPNKALERMFGPDRVSKADRIMARQVADIGHGPGVAFNSKWPRLVNYLVDIDWRTIQRQGGISEVLKAMAEGDGGAGGFLVPEEFRVELLMLALEQAVVRPRAQIIPMGGLTVKIPAILDTSHATSVFGGVQASWVAEAGDLSTVREPTFRQIVLTARKLTGYTRASNELAQDSAISLESIINTLFPQAIAYFEDDAFFNGTGAGQPLGIINADALVSVAKETGQPANTVVYENVIKMFSRMLPQSIARGVWVINPNVFPQLAVMSLSVGTGGSAVWMANATGGPPATILGRPVIFSEKCQTLGTAGDIYFVDFGYYLIGDRMALQILSSPHVRFNNDETVWRFTQRVDGRPWLTSALTPRFGTTTLSPIVALATRA